MNQALKCILALIPLIILSFMLPMVTNIPGDDTVIHNHNYFLSAINLIFYSGVFSYPAYLYVLLLDTDKPLKKSLIRDFWVRLSFLMAGLDCILGIYFSAYMMVIFAMFGLIALIVIIRLLFKYEKLSTQGV